MPLYSGLGARWCCGSSSESSEMRDDVPFATSWSQQRETWRWEDNEMERRRKMNFRKRRRLNCARARKFPRRRRTAGIARRGSGGSENNMLGNLEGRRYTGSVREGEDRDGRMKEDANARHWRRVRYRRYIEGQLRHGVIDATSMRIGRRFRTRTATKRRDARGDDYDERRSTGSTTER